MPIDTRKVAGRRALRFETLNEFFTEAERLATDDIQMLGNWSLGQVFRHLAIAITGSIDGFSFRLWWIEIFFIRLFLKKRMLAHGIPPGLGGAAKWDSVKPQATSTEEGLALLRAALARFQSETKRSPHPAFGSLTSAEWIRFHLRHAELHLSYAVPANSQ